MDVREKLVEIIQNSVGGCARHWAEVISDGLIAHGVTVQEWISVNDGLPEDDVDVLTRRATGMSVEAYHGFGWSYDEYNGRWVVTHWMPLPQPPKGE